MVVGLKIAHATLKSTTHWSIISAVPPISRRCRSYIMYNFKRLHDNFSCDILYSETNSLLQNICAQVYSSKVEFAVCYPISSGTGVSIVIFLKEFCDNF